MQTVRTSGRNTVAVVITTLSYSHLHWLTAADAFNKLQTLSFSFPFPFSLSLSLFSSTDCPRGEKKEPSSEWVKPCAVNSWSGEKEKKWKRKAFVVASSFPWSTYNLQPTGLDSVDGTSCLRCNCHWFTWLATGYCCSLFSHSLSFFFSFFVSP